MLNELSEARRRLGEFTFSVGATRGPVTLNNGAEIDKFIREQTELWRASWILPAMDFAIQELKR